MLLFVIVVGLAFLFGACAVVRIAHVAARRLGLDPWAVVVWFGIAEAPADELAAKRAEPPARVRRERRALAGSLSG